MNNPKCTQEMFLKCENNSLCHLCDGIRLYKSPEEDMKQKQLAKRTKAYVKKNALFRTYTKEKKQGMDFEKKVVKAWNQGYVNKKEDTGLKTHDKPRTHKKPRFGLYDDQPTQSNTAPRKETPISISSLSKAKPKRQVIDAKQQKNSGALWYAKGDVKTEDYLMECKERGTINGRGEKTISIPREWLIKQEKEASQENRPYWVLPFQYKNDEEIYLVKTFDQEIEMYQELRRLREELDSLK